jgi:hypothetical protein
MVGLGRKTASKRQVEFICNYMDEEWLDIIGTNGIRVSIPSMLVKSEILPDDVLSIEVKRDDIKTAKRRQGKLSTMFEPEVFSDKPKSGNSYTNIVYFPNSLTDQDLSNSFDNDMLSERRAKRFLIKEGNLKKRWRKVK